MQIVTCPSPDSFKAFRGGMIALRAAAWMGPARGTLSEVTSAEAYSGSYVQDVQTVSWGGVDHSEDNYSEADDTLVIDPTTLPLELGVTYFPFVTVRLEGTAGVDDGRLNETFWDYDTSVFRLACSEDDFATVLAGSGRAPRAKQTQFSLLWLVPGEFTDQSATWTFRAYRRVTSGGDVAIQIDQLILVPNIPVGGKGREEFSSTSGSKPVEAAVETSLESGIYTLDRGQPNGDYFVDVRDLQDNDGGDPEASSLDIPPAIEEKSVGHIGGGIVFVPEHEVEDDQFTRTVTLVPYGTGLDDTNWGESPYGYHWKAGANVPGFYDSMSGASVDGSQGLLGPVYTPGYYAPLDLNNSGQRSMWQHLGGFRTPPGESFGPTIADGRDWRIRAKLSIDDLPTDVVEGSEGPGYPAPSEDALVHVEVGQFRYVVDDYASSVTARLNILGDGSIELVFAQHYFALTGSIQPSDIEFGTPEGLGTYTPDDWIWVEFAHQGYNIYAKAWFDGDTEPADYQLIDQVRVPFFSGTSQWDVYPYATEEREDQSWSTGDPASRPTGGTPGVAVYAQTHYNTRITLACDEFHVHFHSDELEEEFSPTDVFLRVNEGGSATVWGDTLNMGSVSQNWVLVGDVGFEERVWPSLYDTYQWNDVGSQPLQWMVTGLTYFRRYGFIPQIYRRVFG